MQKTKTLQVLTFSMLLITGITLASSVSATELPISTIGTVTTITARQNQNQSTISLQL